MEIVDTRIYDHATGYIVDIIVKMFCDDASTEKDRFFLCNSELGGVPTCSPRFRNGLRNLPTTKTSRMSPGQGADRNSNEAFAAPM